MISSSERSADIQRADRLWADYARNPDSRTRDAIIQQFKPFAYSLAGRFARRGVQDEDLVQVALLGLVKAVDRFDASADVRFITFATPTILGELRRYFRDCSWRVHVPRGLQERVGRVARAERDLAGQLGRSPTNSEIARRLKLREDEVLEALSLAETSRPLSLDAVLEVGQAGSPVSLEESFGAEDMALQSAECRVSVNQELRRLAEPLRELLQLRYFDHLSQRQVARRLGVSPMQVCRLERRALNLLRRQFAVA
jgi:RNA polymerase sigma-B factor